MASEIDVARMLYATTLNWTGDQESEQAMNARRALAVGIYLCGCRGFPTGQDLSVVDQAYPSRKLAWERSFKAVQCAEEAEQTIDVWSSVVPHIHSISNFLDRCFN